MRVGTAWRDITPDEPIPLGGQMGVRTGEYTRDPLTVNAAAFQDGPDRAVVVSCDVCLLPTAFVDDVKSACAAAHGVDESHVLIACTHTHVAPVTVGWLVGDVIPWFMDGLREAIVEAVGDALGDLEEAEVYAGEGSIEHMGWNRRGLRRDGTAEMYLGSWNEDFAGTEGPRDGRVPVITARGADGRVKLVLPSFATHPNCVEGGSFYSADLPGAVRQVLRSVLGEDVGVVYLTGAAGDTAPSIMEDNPEGTQPWRGEEGLIRSGHYLGGEILKVIGSAGDPMPDPRLVLEHRDLQVPMRPWPDSYDPGAFKAGLREFYNRSREQWPTLLAEENPVEVPVTVLRLGDAAICTNPGELYCQFGLDIKAGSPAEVTILAELTDGCAGYIPTPEAIGRGGYSADPGLQCRLVPEAGHSIVDATHEMLDRAFER